ncbi:MAG: signal peptidase II [Atopococcus tabaci]|uniref:Lipoprotein signal peptidase n=1 Tax=Atopococcus tabaci TaxID=269774 RepID=A0AA43UBP1_9LACT|nr:signal peptidase II [Atopococcus tabaci]
MKYYLLSFIIVIVDQLSKYLTTAYIELGEQVEGLPGLLSITHIHNTGAAWSILEGQMWFFYIVTVIVALMIIYYMQQTKNQPLLQTGLAFILGGAVGNFIDRLLHQYVIDMIQLDFIDFPIFNIADMALTVGVILLFIQYIFFDREEKESKEN